MKLYSISGLQVGYEPRCALLADRSESYRLKAAGAADFVLPLSREQLINEASKNPFISIAEQEYALVGTAFYSRLIEYNGFLLHASAVVLDGEAFCFSASSGTGKSTHTALWLKEFGSRAYIINDDKPAIRLINGEPIVFGTPFSGKTDLNVNTSAPLKGICFLEQARDNSIEKLNARQALYLILNQTIRPSTEERMDKLLRSVEEVLSHIPVYRLSCDISRDAVRLSSKILVGEGS